MNRKIQITIRDLIWFTVVVSVLCAWYVDHIDRQHLPPKILPDFLRPVSIKFHDGTR